MEGFGSPETCRLTKISYRQLDYWARTGLLVPSLTPDGMGVGSGHKRRYSARDVAILRLIKEMLDAGINLQMVRTLAEDLQRITPEPDSVVVVCSGTAVYYPNLEKSLNDLKALLAAWPCLIFPIRTPTPEESYG